MNFRLFRPLIAIAVPLLLLGCSQQIQVCPVAAILADTATVTVFRPGTTPDPANELFTVSLINAETNCTYAKRAATTSSALDLTFRATRAPSAEGASYSVPYFIVVNENEKILNKRILTLHLTFAPGATTTTIKQSPDDTVIHIGNGKLPWNYQLLSGFQVTPAQIEYNKKMGRYVP